MRIPLPFLLLPFLAAGCGGPTETAPTPTEAPADVLLAADLPDAVGVVAAREAGPAEEVALVGRVQRVARGVFVLVDDEVVQFCGQAEGSHDKCPTPWDYCCEDPDKVKASTVVVEATDGEGRPVDKEALGIRPLDLVAVKGRLEQDEAGAWVLHADSGWYRRERPVVGLDVQFR